MANKINILYITKNLAANGITNVVLNYSLKLDKDIFSVTILAGSPIEEIYYKKCIDNGVNVVSLPGKKSHPINYYKKIWKEMKKKYDIVHVHGNSATITIELWLAKMNGIKNRIAHCHNSTCDSVFIHNMMWPLLNSIYTKGYACSNLAGKWMFKKRDFSIIPNGFEISKFYFNKDIRNEIRNRLGLENKLVLGNVARFNDQKNHVFLLQIFESVASINENAVLLLVGNGPKLEKIKQLIDVHPYKDRIIYYGITEDVASLYNAMDIFILPTKYEGLGIVFIEAQINGLPVITSDMVPREVNICRNVHFLSLDESKDVWAKEVLSVTCKDRGNVRERYSDAIQAYDINNTVKILETEYMKLCKVNVV